MVCHKSSNQEVYHPCRLLIVSLANIALIIHVIPLITTSNFLITFFRFSEVRFVDGDKLFASGLPVTPAEFESLVKQQCAKTREFLKKT